MRNYTGYIILTILIFSFGVLISRSFRVQQIPNGGINSCANCHNNPNGGGARNAFGSAVESSFLSGGNVQWGPSLAALDSDGDGFSNGAELQDPDGSWIQGQTAPGDPALVTNPGDPNSTPNPTSVTDLGIFPGRYALSNNYPNPFNPTTNIAFSLPEASNVRIEIYNSLGQLINTLVNSTYGAGSFNAVWDAVDQYGSKLGSGLYIYRMTASSLLSDKNFVDTKRMLLVK